MGGRARRPVSTAHAAWLVAGDLPGTEKSETFRHDNAKGGIGLAVHVSIPMT
jgi:hypothetical protein